MWSWTIVGLFCLLVGVVSLFVGLLNWLSFTSGGPTMRTSTIKPAHTPSMKVDRMVSRHLAGRLASHVCILRTRFVRFAAVVIAKQPRTLYGVATPIHPIGRGSGRSAHELFQRLGELLTPFVDLLPINRDLRRRFDAEADVCALHFHNLDPNVVVDDNAFPDAA